MRIENCENEIKEITGVDYSIRDRQCELTWRAVGDGVIICKSDGFREWPDITVLEELDSAKENVLFGSSNLQYVTDDGISCELKYIPANIIAASGGKTNFSMTGNATPPLKIQIWSVNSEKTTVYSPISGQNKVVIPATVKVGTKIVGLLKKEKEVLISMPNKDKCPNGFMCYKTAAAGLDDYGFPMEYPIPNSKIGSPFCLPLSQDYQIDVSRQWKDVINVETTAI